MPGTLLLPVQGHQGPPLLSKPPEPTWARVTRLAVARGSGIITQLPFQGAAPAKNALLIAALYGRNSINAAATMTGWGLTWTLINRYRAAVNTDSLWYFRATTAGAVNGGSTPLFDTTADSANEILGAIWQFLGPDSSFVPFVRQEAEANFDPSATTPFANFNSPPLPWNATVVFEGNEVNNVVTPPAGFIEYDDITAGANSGFETAYQYPASTQNISWGSTLNGWATLAVEVYMDPIPDPMAAGVVGTKPFVMGIPGFAPNPVRFSVPGDTTPPAAGNVTLIAAAGEMQFGATGPIEVSTLVITAGQVQFSATGPIVVSTIPITAGVMQFGATGPVSVATLAIVAGEMQFGTSPPVFNDGSGGSGLTLPVTAGELRLGATGPTVVSTIPITAGVMQFGATGPIVSHLLQVLAGEMKFQGGVPAMSISWPVTAGTMQLSAVGPVRQTLFQVLAGELRFGTTGPNLTGANVFIQHYDFASEQISGQFKGQGR